MWREEDHTLHLVSKDFETNVVLSTSFVIDGAKLGILKGDDAGNLELLQQSARYGTAL